LQYDLLHFRCSAHRFILWLPAFPDGDGALHTYYAQIFHELASGAPTVYSHYYALRHLVQPYCLHYFVLIFFEQWCSPLKAEELFVSVILITTALGFRFMARRLGQHASLVSLFIVPMLLDWTLGAGFLNYCFAAGISFWCVGFWNMLRPGRSVLPLLGFVAMLLLLVLSHPMPLMILILLLGSDLALLLWGGRANLRYTLATLRWRVAALALSLLALLIPTSMAESSKVTSVWRDFFPHRSVLMHFIEARSLGYFAGSMPLALLYSMGLLLLIPATILLLQRDFRMHWRTRTLTAADRQLLIMSLFLLLTITLPRTVAGGSSFSERMWDTVWPLVFVTASAATLTSAQKRMLTIAGGLLIVLTGCLAVPRVYAFSLKHDALAHAVLPRDRQGLLIEPFSTTLGRPRSASYPIFFWSGMRAFTASHSVLFNSPWLDEKQIPVRSNGPSKFGEAHFTQFITDQPPYFTDAIIKRIPAALNVLHEVDFILYVAPNERPQDLPGQVAHILGPEASDWTCTPSDLYVLCVVSKSGPEKH
jgi:hypothetical protein